MGVITSILMIIVVCIGAVFTGSVGILMYEWVKQDGKNPGECIYGMIAFLVVGCTLFKGWF